MAVVDSVSSVQDVFQNKSDELLKKLDTTTAKIKNTVAISAVGFFFITGIVSASAFSLVFGTGLLIGTLFNDSRWGQSLGHIAVSTFVTTTILVFLLFWKRSLLKSRSDHKHP